MRKSLTLAILSLFAFCGVAMGADLPNKKVEYKAPVVAAPAASGFFIGAMGGIGLSKTQSALTFPGIVQGPLGAYPTGIQAGGVLGYSGLMGSIYYGATVEALYDFSRGDVSSAVYNTGAGTFASASRKNGILLQEGAELGLSLASITGYVPTAGQPQNWPIPITVPSSFASNLIVAARGGVAERDISLCGAIDNLGDSGCNSKFIVAPYAGLKIKAMLSQQTEVFATWDHIFWNQSSSFTPGTAGGFTPFSTVTVSSEDAFRLGAAYHLTPGTSLFGF